MYSNYVISSTAYSPATPPRKSPAKRPRQILVHQDRSPARIPVHTSKALVHRNRTTPVRTARTTEGMFLFVIENM